MQTSSSLLIFPISVHVKLFHFLSSSDIVLLAWQQQIDGIIHSPTFSCAGGGAQAFSGAGLLSSSTVIPQEQNSAISSKAVPLAEMFCIALLREWQFSSSAFDGVIAPGKQVAPCLASKIITGGCSTLKFADTMWRT